MPTYTVGSGKTYSTIQAALDAIPSNLSGTGINLIEIDAGVYAESLSYTKTNASASNYIHLIAALGSEHKMVFDVGVVIRISGINLSTVSAFSRFSNLQFESTGNSCVNFTSSSCIFENVLFATNTADKNCFTFGASGVATNTLYKCLALYRGASNHTTVAAGFFTNMNNGSSTSNFYNCGSYGYTLSYTANGSGTILYQNCWGVHTTSGPATKLDWQLGFGPVHSGACSNNASTDTTAPGFNVILGKNVAQFAFVDATLGNFHITLASILAGGGISKSSLFTMDIDLESILSWPIGPDSLTAVPASQASTSSSSPWVNNNVVHRTTSDAKDFSPNIQNSDSSIKENNPSSVKDAEGYPLSGKKGLRTGFISVMPELNGYGASSPALGTGFMMPFLSESLAIDKAFRDLDVVGRNRITNQRRPMYTTPQGAVEFALRSNDIIPILQSHFQKRIGTTLSVGTTYYEFVPTKGRVDLVGSQFGTGSYTSAASCNALSLSVYKNMAGTGILFKTGVADKLTFKMHSIIEPTVSAEFQFREGTVMGTSSSHPYGTYSSLGEYSPTTCSVDFLGLSVLDFEFTSDDNVELRNVLGDNRPIHKFGRYELKGKATVDLSKDRLKHFGTVLSGSSFSVSATMFNGAHDRIIFQMADCRMNEFSIGVSDIYSVPFQAFASEDGSTAPIKIGVWTQHYSATSFQPN